MRNFRNYEIWKNGMDIVDVVYMLTNSFPKYETYGLCDQVRRASVSIPSNIAEGSSRTSLSQLQSEERRINQFITKLKNKHE